MVFIFLFSITIGNVYLFGLKETSEQRPQPTQTISQQQTIETPAPEKLTAVTESVRLNTWRETEYQEYRKVISAKPDHKKSSKTPMATGRNAVAANQAKKKSTKPTIVSNGIKYVKIPFKGKFIYVSSDYYKVDGMRKPLSRKQAEKIARQHGAVLPTKEMVDAIWKYADLKLNPQPLPAGPLMTKPVYFAKHNEMIEKQINHRSYELVAGHKKDIIRPERQGRVTLYGWHRLNGVPIQPITNVHDDNYGDYANCLRLVKLHS